MSKTTVYHGQNLFNKTIEVSGNVNDAFAMALLNGISVTDSLIIGQELLKVPVSNKSVVSFFNEKKPATAMTLEQENVLIPKLGIGTMVINSTFTVG